jgi:hypothetical protein
MSQKTNKTAYGIVEREQVRPTCPIVFAGEADEASFDKISRVNPTIFMAIGASISPDAIS